MLDRLAPWPHRCLSNLAFTCSVAAGYCKLLYVGMYSSPCMRDNTVKYMEGYATGPDRRNHLNVNALTHELGRVRREKAVACHSTMCNYSFSCVVIGEWTKFYVS
ncbi:hypothetical protein F5Y03DRAFT_355696 [Xylaria venustula]|nr:hypothetical protein F5Y03DRAFT_355696 [Xylaria venustula]